MDQIMEIVILIFSGIFAFFIGFLYVEFLNYMFNIFPEKTFTSILIEWYKSSDDDDNDPNGCD